MRLIEQIGAAIFDLDGTLIDSMGVWERVDRRFLTNHGFGQDEYYIQALKNRNYRECAEFTIDYLGVDMTPAQLMAEWDAMAVWEYAHAIDMKNGAKELLKVLYDRQIPIVLATVSHPGLYEAVLKRHGVYPLFTGFTDESMANKGKGSPDIYLQAARIAGRRPQDCIVFEDVLRGILSAREAGCITCAVEDGSQAADRKAILTAADHYAVDPAAAVQLLMQEQ